MAVVVAVDRVQVAHRGDQVGGRVFALRLPSALQAVTGSRVAVKPALCTRDCTRLASLDASSGGLPKASRREQNQKVIVAAAFET